MAGPRAIHGDGRLMRPRKSFAPAYLKAREEGGFRERVERALALLSPSCRVCPRSCRDADRGRDETGLCGVWRSARVSGWGAHLGEEDVLRGWKGSGTIFFAQCNLRCVFCQNHDISQTGRGDEVGPKELAAMMLRLQDTGCHNINLVTPSHVVAQIVEALALAVEGGLKVPLVYNTGSYDGLESLELMGGLVDIYMPDFKFWDPAASGRYLLAPDYPAAARRAVAEMRRQVGDLVVDEDGVAVRGVLVRHLVMPGMAEDSGRVLRWLAGLSKDTYVNIMDQYRPAWKAREDPRYAPIGRCVPRREMEAVGRLAVEAGLWRFDDRWRRLYPVGEVSC